MDSSLNITRKKIEITYGQNPYVIAKISYVIILHTDLHLPTEYYIRIYSICNEYCLKKLFTFCLKKLLTFFFF